MIVVIRLCYLCYTNGVETPATHRYYAPQAEEWYDVCGDHLTLVKADGHKVEPIETIQEIKEVNQ